MLRKTGLKIACVLKTKELVFYYFLSLVVENDLDNES